MIVKIEIAFVSLLDLVMSGGVSNSLKINMSLRLAVVVSGEGGAGC